MRISCQNRYIRALDGAWPYLTHAGGNVVIVNLCPFDWSNDYVVFKYEIGGTDPLLTKRRFLYELKYHVGPEFVFVESYSPDSRKHLRNEQLVMHHWPKTNEVELYRYYKKSDERP